MIELVLVVILLVLWYIVRFVHKIRKDLRYNTSKVVQYGLNGIYVYNNTEDIRKELGI